MTTLLTNFVDNGLAAISKEIEQEERSLSEGELRLLVELDRALVEMADAFWGFLRKELRRGVSGAWLREQVEGFPLVISKMRESLNKLLETGTRNRSPWVQVRVGELLESLEEIEREVLRLCRLLFAPPPTFDPSRFPSKGKPENEGNFVSLSELLNHPEDV